MQLKFAGFLHCPTTEQHSNGLTQGVAFGQWHNEDGGGPVSSEASTEASTDASIAASTDASTEASTEASGCSGVAFTSTKTSASQPQTKTVTKKVAITLRMNRTIYAHECKCNKAKKIGCGKFSQCLMSPQEPSNLTSIQRTIRTFQSTHGRHTAIESSMTQRGPGFSQA